MHIELLQHGLLLRALLVVALATPLFIVALLCRGLPRSWQPRTRDVRASPRADADGQSGAAREAPVAAIPRPWRPAGVGPSRRAA